ncbi:hypothetical protein PHMEG_00018310 [Phytophthora megakarya]|uniref:Uncharacterized protein n=1 Tax=Phytophthora megakarya TaxID=4795 RepID=A0A225VUF0_9STRA|nr:hypothetical protein PHMEG_00018310 [Phytophthora megakarya]
MLTASRMFDLFGTAPGTSMSAVSFVLWLKELDCIKFVVTPVVRMAIFSMRLGSRGLTLIHFRESTDLDTLEDGSSNVNFASDFSPSAALPSASARCLSYEDILDAIHGFGTMGQEVWYDRIRKLTSRKIPHDIYDFTHQKSCDVAETPVRQPPFSSG